VTGTKAAALAYVPYAVLAANLATQAVCVTGVNQLTSVRPPALAGCCRC
jgi:hypothetical protein